MESAGTPEKLSEILDEIEAALKSGGHWLTEHPVDAREHMAPEHYLQFYFLPEERERLSQKEWPRESAVLFNASHDFENRPEFSDVLRLLLEYALIVRARLPEFEPTSVYIQLALTASADIVRRAFSDAFAKYRPQIKVRGFPAGTAPDAELLKVARERILRDIEFAVPRAEFERFAKMLPFKPESVIHFSCSERPAEGAPLPFKIFIRIRTVDLPFLEATGAEIAVLSYAELNRAMIASN